jgi:hypothetical protein
MSPPHMILGQTTFNSLQRFVNAFAYRFLVYTTTGDREPIFDRSIYTRLVFITNTASSEDQNRMSNPDERVYVNAEDARKYVEGVLEGNGAPEETAKVVARCLVEADLRGMDSHGELAGCVVNDRPIQCASSSHPLGEERYR